MEQADGGRRSGGPAIASSGLTSLHSTPMRKRFRPASAVIWPFEALVGKWDRNRTGTLLRANPSAAMSARYAFGGDRVEIVKARDEASDNEQVEA